MALIDEYTVYELVNKGEKEYVNSLLKEIGLLEDLDFDILKDMIDNGYEAHFDEYDYDGIVAEHEFMTRVSDMDIVDGALEIEYSWEVEDFLGYDEDRTPQVIKSREYAKDVWKNVKGYVGIDTER